MVTRAWETGRSLFTRSFFVSFYIAIVVVFVLLSFFFLPFSLAFLRSLLSSVSPYFSLFFVYLYTHDFHPHDTPDLSFNVSLTRFLFSMRLLFYTSLFTDTFMIIKFTTYDVKPFIQTIRFIQTMHIKFWFFSWFYITEFIWFCNVKLTLKKTRIFIIKIFLKSFISKYWVIIK